MCVPDNSVWYVRQIEVDKAVRIAKSFTAPLRAIDQADKITQTAISIFDLGELPANLT